MRRNYTREILAQVARGRIAVNSMGPETPVRYEPRSKSDPQPWTNGFFRYSGRYVHTVAERPADPCRYTLAQALREAHDPSVGDAWRKSSNSDYAGFKASVGAQ